MLVDGYVRVSQVRGRSGPSFISPSEQRDQIVGWTRLHGAQVVEVFEELDESGARNDRPLLMRAIERVERGETNGLVVARLDRFGRSLVGGLTAIERIHRAGGVFVAVQDGFDLRTPTGKLVLRIMLSMAEFELDRMRANYAAARSRAVARGVHIAKCPPVGYRWRDDHTLEPDPAVAPFIARVFRMRASASPWSQISRMLREGGIRTQTGLEFFEHSAVYRIIHNRAYLGEIKNGEHVNRHAHEPLIDELTWQQAQNPLALVPWKPGSQSMLHGLVRCAACRHAMGAENRPQASGRVPRYHCTRLHAAGPCPAPTSVRAQDIEGLAERIFFDALRHPPDELVATRKKIKGLERQAALAQAALLTFRDDPRVLDVLGTDRYILGLRERTRQLEDTQRTLALTRATLHQPPMPPLPKLTKTWPGLPLADKRLLISRIIDCIFIRPWRKGPIDGRAWVCLHGQAPPDLPRRGILQPTVRPYHPPGEPDWWREHYTPTTHWTTQRIEEELRPFLAGRDKWPTQTEFRETGRAALLDALYRRGGSITWAKHMGIKPTHR